MLLQKDEMAYIKKQEKFVKENYIPADDVCQEVRMTARQQRLDEAARLCGRLLETPQLRPASVKALATIILDIALTDLQAEEGGEIALGMLLYNLLSRRGMHGPSFARKLHTSARGSSA
jgi:hypothetical protein